MNLEIQIISFRKPIPARLNVIRVDRGSPLGNPFVMHRELDRNWACDQYEAWLQEHQNDPQVKAAIDYIVTQAKKGPVGLLCWCAPKRCHAEGIRNLVQKFAKD